MSKEPIKIRSISLEISDSMKDALELHLWIQEYNRAIVESELNKMSREVMQSMDELKHKQ